MIHHMQRERLTLNDIFGVTILTKRFPNLKRYGFI
jgi:hypothetical protein